MGSTLDQDYHDNHTSEKGWMDHSQLLIVGYIRENNQTWKLRVPQDICNMILMYYGQMRYFEVINVEHFQLSQFGTIITPMWFGRDPRNFMMCPTPNGFKRGVHEWRVKKLSGTGLCRHAIIGVTTNIQEREYMIREGLNSHEVWPWIRYNCKSYWSGNGADQDRNWKVDETILVILNIDKQIVEYYRDDVKLKEEILQTRNDGTYHFVIIINSQIGNGTFQCV